MGKIKIAWLTGQSFIDVDSNIVPELAKYFDIRWVVLHNKKCWYSIEEIKSVFCKTNCECKILSFTSRMSSISTAKIYRKALKYMKEFNPDFYYINNIGIPYLWPMILLSSIPNDGIIYPCHDFKDHVGVKNRLYYVMTKKLIFHFIQHFQFFSNTQKSMFESVYHGKQVFFAPLALKDFGGVHNCKKEKEKVQFLFFGTIRENKGLQYLIEAVNMISEKYHGRFIVKIAGGCSKWSQFEQLIKTPDDYEIEIRRIQNEEIPVLFARSHYLVLPYIDVTQSGPLLISYNYHIPVLASDHEGFREYIDDKNNGFLFKNQDSSSLAETMAYIIDHHDNYSQICANLDKFIDEQCSIQSIIRKYRDGIETFYDDKYGK